MTHSDSHEWRGYVEDALMAHFMKLPMFPEMPAPQAVIPLGCDSNERCQNCGSLWEICNCYNYPGETEA
jgi:hypothetical protein